MPFHRSELESNYYIENYTKRVPYTVHWVDSDFKSYLYATYGDPKKFLDKAASMVSILPTGEIAYSYPTAGRAIMGRFDKPFKDPITSYPITEYDVKGCLFTESGYKTYRSLIQYPEERLEIHRRADDLTYIYGPLSLKEAVTDQKLTTLARDQGIETVCPLAILVPQKMVYEGHLISIEEYVDRFELQNSEYGLKYPALYLRGYPVTGARSADIIVDGTNCRIPEIARSSNERFAGELWPKDYKTLVNLGRSRWQEIEMPKIMKVLKVKNEKEFQNKYFGSILKTITSQAIQMILSGITPATGDESAGTESHRNHHTHIQNKTVFRATEVEFAPTVVLEELDPSNRYSHLRTLLCDAHDYLVNAGIYSSTDLEKIPSFHQFIDNIRQGCGEDIDLDHIYETYRPLTDKDAENLKKGVKSSKVLQIIATGDSVIENLIKQFGSKF